jgi:predicted Fe-Mo cluster-binding NifX family protein
MRLCIPTLDENGLAAELSDHFGSAPHLTLVDSENGEVAALASGHGEGKDCGRVGLLSGERIDAVVVRSGIGRGAYAALTGRGIPVFVSSGPCVGDVVAEARKGVLLRLDADRTCSHHHAGGCKDESGGVGSPLSPLDRVE